MGRSPFHTMTQHILYLDIKTSPSLAYNQSPKAKRLRTATKRPKSVLWLQRYPILSYPHTFPPPLSPRHRFFILRSPTENPTHLLSNSKMHTQLTNRPMNQQSKSRQPSQKKNPFNHSTEANPTPAPEQRIEGDDESLFHPQKHKKKQRQQRQQQHNITLLTPSHPFHPLPKIRIPNKPKPANKQTNTEKRKGQRALQSPTPNPQSQSPTTTAPRPFHPIQSSQRPNERTNEEKHTRENGNKVNFIIYSFKKRMIDRVLLGRDRNPHTHTDTKHLTSFLKRRKQKKKKKETGFETIHAYCIP